MKRLFDFLYRHRETGLFLALEIVSIWLLIVYNRRYNASFLNSGNKLAASVSQVSGSISNYFLLAETNEQLVDENEQLLRELTLLRQKPLSYRDTIGRFSITRAKVVNNTFSRSMNYITISAGERDSIKTGMGVIAASGVVGQVKSVSKNFATVYSLLHPNLMVSSIIRRTNTKATVQWDQKNYGKASLKYIPRHVSIEKGDTIVTSGFNSVFPEDILIGVIEEFDLSEEMTFYEAKVKLATDFTSLKNLYVINDLLKNEKDSLQHP